MYKSWHIGSGLKTDRVPLGYDKKVYNDQKFSNRNDFNQ